VNKNAWVIQQNNAEASGNMTAIFKNTISNAAYIKTLGASPIPHISVDVRADVTSEYYIWLKVYTPKLWSSYTDGVYCYIGDDNDTDTFYWRQPLTKTDGSHSASNTDFYWVRVYQEYLGGNAHTGATQVGEDRVYNWTAGQTYTLNFRAYNSGVQIDQIYITSDPNDIPHIHSFGTAWESDATHHWHKGNCGHDELIIDKAEHTFENLLDTTCDVCGYERPAHVCTPDEAWHSNGTHHWHECLCGAKPGMEEHRFVNNVCTVCNTLKDLVAPAGVSIVEDYDGYVGADWISRLGLPAKVMVAGAEVDVQWEDVASIVNPDVVGIYSVPGTVLGVQKAVYFKVEVRAYSNLLANYNASFENSAANWSIRDNKGFTKDPVKHGTYATNQVLPASWNAGGQVAYSYDGQSSAYADLVTATGAGEYWYGTWAKIGADTVTGVVNTNFKLYVYMYRTTQLDADNSGVGYDSSRQLRCDAVPLNSEDFTRVGFVANLDGTDEHLRFYVNTAGSGVGNDRLHLDNMELVPLKLPLVG
jgi:hypothetical protein